MRDRRFLRMQLEVVEDRLVPSSTPAAVPHPAGYDAAIARIDPTHEAATFPEVRNDSRAANDRISISIATITVTDPNPDPFFPARPAPVATIHLSLQSVSLVQEAEHHVASRDRTIDLPPIQESPAIVRSRLLSTPITPHHTEVLAFSHVAAVDSLPVNAEWNSVTGLKSWLKGKQLPAFTRHVPEALATPAATVAETDPPADEAIVDEVELPLDAIVSLFPAGTPIAGAVAWNLAALEQCAAALLAELPDSGIAEALADPERYLWVSAAALVAATTVGVTRIQRPGRDAVPVVLGADSIPPPRAKSQRKEPLRVRGS